jgi:hypothetical protein
MAWFKSMPSTGSARGDPSGQPAYFVAHAAADLQEVLPGAGVEELGHAPLDRLDVRQPVHPRQEGEQPVTAGISIGPLEARMQIRHGDTPGLTWSRPGCGGRPRASIPDFWVEARGVGMVDPW